MKKNGKVRKDKPSDILRQTRLAKLIAENGGKTPIGKLMIQAGYAPGYARNPDKLKKTLSWEQLMQKNLPDDLISQKHNELLSSMTIDHYIFPNAVTDEMIKQILDQVAGCKLLRVQRNPQWARAFFAVPDNRSRKDAIDMAYKLKGKYPKGSQEEHEVIIHVKND